jgi:hypothetical protein
MLFLMKRVKFSASRRRAGLGETALTHRPSPGVPLCALQCEINTGEHMVLLQLCDSDGLTNP